MNTFQIHCFQANEEKRVILAFGLLHVQENISNNNINKDITKTKKDRTYPLDFKVFPY